MRVALCLEYPIEQFGGTEILVRELVQGLAPRHEIVLVSNNSVRSLQESSIAPLVRKHLHWQPASPTFLDAKNLATALVHERIDLAHFHFGGTFGWGSRRLNFAPPIHTRRLGVPCLATNHGVFSVFDGYVGAQRSLFTKLALLPAAWASRLQLITHVEAEVAVSMNDYRALCHRYWPVRGKFRQIYHSRIRERDVLESRARSKTILCVGTLGPRKGQPYLAFAFAKIAAQFPDWNLLFIGRGGDEETTAELRGVMARPELHGRLRWIPGCSDEELKYWFQSVEIFAMPSLDEGLGLTLQEALYYGCACVASRAGGIPDLIQDGDNGILAEPANADALAGALSTLIKNDNLRRRFAARARPSMLEKNMTSERMVASYEALYLEILQA